MTNLSASKSMAWLKQYVRLPSEVVVVQVMAGHLSFNDSNNNDNNDNVSVLSFLSLTCQLSVVVIANDLFFCPIARGNKQTDNCQQKPAAQGIKQQHNTKHLLQHQTTTNSQQQQRTTNDITTSNNHNKVTSRLKA